jgi:hypothetical protein
MDLDRELAENLTPREIEVLSLVAGGLSNCEVAEALCMIMQHCDPVGEVKIRWGEHIGPNPAEIRDNPV